MNILLVEDDKANALLVKKLLSEQGYEVECAFSIKEAKAYLDKALYSLIILDWNLPDGCGYDLLLELRELLIESQILMLSANSDVEYRVKALNGGSDDYLCKPYSQMELLARVQSLLRRNSSNKNMIITIGNVKINTTIRDVTCNEQSILLTQAEYQILETLASNPNKIFSKFELSNLIHSEYDNSTMSNVIEVHIKNIRKKLERKDIIKNLRSVGYQIATI